MTLTIRDVVRLASDRGGFTGAVWAGLQKLFPDIEFTPGWIQRLAGREVTDAQFTELLTLRNVSLKAYRRQQKPKYTPPVQTSTDDDPPWEGEWKFPADYQI